MSDDQDTRIIVREGSVERTVREIALDVTSNRGKQIRDIIRWMEETNFHGKITLYQGEVHIRGIERTTHYYENKVIFRSKFQEVSDESFVEVHKGEDRISVERSPKQWILGDDEGNSK